MDELLQTEIAEVPRLYTAVSGPTHQGEYLHWDKLRRLQPPTGLEHRQWWLALKLRRTIGQRTSIPLHGTDGRPLSFISIDPMPEWLHHIDLGAGGSIEIPEQITNPDTRDRYIVHSLMEEAITSSQLEGAATTRPIAREMIRSGRPPRDKHEQMILNNYATMKSIREFRTEPLTPQIVFELQRRVTSETLDDQSAAGRLRREDERVRVEDEYGEVFHLPPPAGELPGRLQSMCDFANATTPFIHPVIRSIALHFWLAYDHPFTDGNGRCARALFYWSMLHHGYGLFEFISISQMILKAPTKYYRAFLHTETDDNDLTYFILYHMEIIREAVEELHAYVARKSAELRDVDRQLRAVEHLNHRQRALISHAVRHPDSRYTIESHRTSHDVVYETARTDLLDLAAQGFLSKSKAGKTWVFALAPGLEGTLQKSR